MKKTELSAGSYLLKKSLMENFSLHFIDTTWKVSKYGVISGPYFPTKYLSVFSPNAGKYEPEITPYFYIFHAVDRIK